ncbi:MAG: hypothetical protein HYU29_04785 [Chloroflexi bacterium]|nr:hypothetical protein [Chloroflexota bacterium]
MRNRRSKGTKTSCFGSPGRPHAIANSIAVILHTMLSYAIPYVDLGGNYFDQRGRQAILQPSVRRIERLGYRVTLEMA